MGEATIDYDLHGIVGVRLVGADAAEASAVDRQLGGMRGALRRAPDVVVRFVDRVEVAGPVRLLGAGEAGFGADAFLLLRGRRKARARVRIDVDRIGERCEIVAERGLRGRSAPDRRSSTSTALARGVLPLHASAFDRRGRRACSRPAGRRAARPRPCSPSWPAARASSATSGSMSPPTVASTGCPSRCGCGTGTCASCRRSGRDRPPRSRPAAGPRRRRRRSPAGAAPTARRPRRRPAPRSTRRRHGSSTPRDRARRHRRPRVPHAQLGAARRAGEPGRRDEVAARMAASLRYERAPAPAVLRAVPVRLPRSGEPAHRGSARPRGRSAARISRRPAGARRRPSLSRSGSGSCSTRCARTAEPLTRPTA